MSVRRKLAVFTLVLLAAFGGGVAAGAAAGPFDDEPAPAPTETRSPFDHGRHP